MEAVDKRALDSNTRFLQNNVVLTAEVFGGLIENQVLTAEMMEKIKSKQTSCDQVLALIQLLKKRGARAFSHFVNVLRETDQSHIAERLQIYAGSQRRGSTTDVTQDKMKTFIHKTFIQNRKFALDDEKFLLDNLVMREDWEIQKIMKEDALDKQAQLEIEVNAREKELGDVNRRLELSLAQHKKNLIKIAQIEGEKCELQNQIIEMEAMVEEMKDREVLEDVVDGGVPSHPMSPQISTSSTNINEELMQIQEEELENTRRQLDILRVKVRLSDAKVNALTAKVKGFVKVMLHIEDECNARNTPLQNLEANIKILMNQLKGLDVKLKERATHKPDEVLLLMDIKLKDKLNETRKQKAILKSELQNVNTRLHSITDELEAQKQRVKHLEAEVQSRDSQRSDSPPSDLTTSRVKTPVNFHFPVLTARKQRQQAMFLWKSLPSGMTLENDERIKQHHNTQHPISNLKSDVIQKVCHRCHIVYTANDSKVRRTCRYHPSSYEFAQHPGMASKWPCCGQNNRSSLGCRYGNHTGHIERMNSDCGVNSS